MAIKISGTTVIDDSRNFYGNGGTLSFGPTIISYTPSLASTNNSITTNITFTFDQNIQFSGSGTITLRTVSASGTIVESFVLGSSPRVTISGNQLIIDPTSNLSTNTVYFVVLPSSGIADLFGNLYTGSSNYNFTTSSISDGTSVSGGNSVFTTGGFRYHVFTSSGTLNLATPTANLPNFYYLLVGGGGNGGSDASPTIRGGGGGGGAVLYGSSLALSQGQYNISIGGGGSESSITTAPTPSFAIRARQGGPGSNGPGDGNTGASGGGGGNPSTTLGGFGFLGGNGSPGPGGGRGGGSGNPGPSGGQAITIPQFPSSILSGNVPSMPTNSINDIGFGSYASGGGAAWGSPPGGPGGAGRIQPNPFPQNGLANTGGGGANFSPGGSAGGSGIFIIRYSV